MGLNETALGTCQICSLISPVVDVASQEDAVSIAGQVMEALFVSESDAARDAARKVQAEAARLNGEPVLQQPLSRRDFIRGAFLGM
jgi:hypothetical protein